MTENQRLAEVVNYLRENKYIRNQQDFTERIGANKTTISLILNGKSKIPNNMFAKIEAAFPDINKDWLLTGEGEMLNEETAQHPQSETIIPLLPVEAMAGSLSEWSESVGINNCIMIPSPIPSADYAMQVSGDSMEPELHNGSYIYIKKINSRLFIPWGAILVVDTENGVVVKRVYPVDDDDTVILAKSINPKYPPFKIPLNSVYNMFRVLGSTRILSTL